MECLHKEIKARPDVPFDHTKGDCRICWSKLPDGQRVESNGSFSSHSHPAQRSCRHLGDEVPLLKLVQLGLPTSKVYRECELGYGPQCRCNQTCNPNCKGYSADMSYQDDDIIPLIRAPEHMQRCVVTIGSYGMPGVIELQAKAIRANCGDVPIVVSDDHTEEAGPTGCEKKSRLLDICKDNNLQYHDAHENRIGHAGGDLGAFWHGLQFAKRYGYPYVLKLSQRLVIDRPNFLHRCIEILQKHQGHTMSQTHRLNGAFYFNMRTEFVLMDVRRWGSDFILEQLKPRIVAGATEVVIHNCVKQMGGAIVSCPLITPERGKTHVDTYWYQQPDAAEAYETVAKKYDVELGDGFHVGGSHLSPNYKGG